MQHKFYIYREKRNLGHPETASLVKKAAAAALHAEGVDEPCEIGVTLTNNEGIRVINRALARTCGSAGRGVWRRI